MMLRPERVEMSTLLPAVEGRGREGKALLGRWAVALSSWGMGRLVGRGGMVGSGWWVS